MSFYWGPGPTPTQNLIIEDTSFLHNHFYRKRKVSCATRLKHYPAIIQAYLIVWNHKRFLLTSGNHAHSKVNTLDKAVMEENKYID